jgi:hypothetical protein
MPYSRDPARLIETAKRAAEFVRREYSPEAERESIVGCWEAILG